MAVRARQAGGRSRCSPARRTSAGCGCSGRASATASSALEEAGRWITVDPLDGYTDVAVQPVPAGFDLAGFYRERGFTVVETQRQRRVRPAPLLPATCVEVAKRVLGIASWRVLTPGQLHDFLLRNG